VTEKAGRKRVGMRGSFLNRGCGIEGNWETGRMEVLSGPCFPRLPQEAQKGLCKANGLCEKQVRRYEGQGVAEDGLCTETGEKARAVFCVLLAGSLRKQVDSRLCDRRRRLPIPVPCAKDELLLYLFSKRGNSKLDRRGSRVWASTSGDWKIN